MGKDVVIISAIIAGISGITIAYVIFRYYGKDENKKNIIFRWSLIGIGLLLGLGWLLYVNLR